MNLAWFTIFPRLPPELRDQIWRNALPGNRPTLYFYKKGYWQARAFTELEEDYTSENAGQLELLEFRHDLLDYVHVKVSLINVNHEARDIALAWAQENGIQIKYRQNGSQPQLLRPFNPKYDALYVSPDRWDEFIDEPADRQFQPDLRDRMVLIKPGLHHIAVPKSFILDEEPGVLHGVFGYSPGIYSFIIIIGPVPELEPANSGGQVQPHWEIEHVQKGFQWNYDRGIFEQGSGQCFEDTYDVIKRASQELPQCIDRSIVRNLDVRAAFAVRKC